MRLADLHVERYGPLPRFSHECDGNFEVFYGPNESGKTLLLEAVLKLLAPDVESAIPRAGRVDETPTGHVVVETNGSEQKLGDGTVLGDVSDLTPHHLRNVFVVRDSDLHLSDEHAFYDSVTQQIGNLHTTELEAIRDRLAESGRLTSVDGRRDLSAASDKDDAADVRDTAEALAADIREYVDEAEAEDVAAAEREFVAFTADIRECERSLAEQEAAETWDRHETLAERLETYRTASQDLDADVSRSTLDELERLDRDLAEADDAIADLERRRDTLREERTQFESELESVEAALAPLETRADDVDEVERRLDAYRDAAADSTGATRGMGFARLLALGGVGFGGAAAVLGQVVPAAVLAVIGGLAAVWYWRQHRAVAAAERERAELLQAAQDTGLDVSDIDEVGTAIRAFRDDLDERRARRDELDRQIDVKDDLLAETEDELDAERAERRRQRERRTELLQSADVSDVAAYRERVESNEALAAERDQAAQSLTDALGEPPGFDGDAASTLDAEVALDYWETELSEMVEGVDGDVAADEYDPDELATLQEERERLQQLREDLANRLDDHERRLRQFESRIGEVSARPFLDETVTLDARSVAGLREAARDLEALVDRIERDADVAREALSVFDEIQATEEQKIADLFGPESRATQVFRRITEDRYTGVTYDAADKTLRVHRDGAESCEPGELSHGTTEQLYLAARIGLAEQLLPAEPGFFIMDDAFLPADRDRLRQGFDVLKRLAADGWQILYFTAKEEVGEDLVSVHDLPRRTLEQLR